MIQTNNGMKQQVDKEHMYDHDIQL